MKPDGRRDRWWDNSDSVRHRLAGVFEGGGAKGVAYVGALEATLEKRAWFGAVAGASAGAITASLIAAGLTPKELHTESDKAFERLRLPTIGRGLLQLRLNFGFLDNEAVRDWLEGVLARQVKAFGVPVEGAVTFATLYAATEIELNVVVADLSRGSQIVCSAWDTPRAQVAEAVLASSSIPFAFAARGLVPDPRASVTHTLADGGVWSNFPTFVFLDRSFREASGRHQLVSEDHVVGYLLEEEGDIDPEVSDATLVDLANSPPALEWASHDEVGTPRRGMKGVLDVAGTILLAPLLLILRLAAWLSLGDSQAWKGRWPQPKGLAGRVLGLVSDSLSALHSFWFAAPVALASVAGAALTIYWIVDSFLILRIEEIELDLAFGPTFSIISELIQVVLAMVAIALVATLTVMVLAALAGNYLLLGPMRQVMFGLARTYAAGPGAPKWAGRASGDNVIRLPIPKGLSTLSFDRSPPDVGEAIDDALADARRVTSEKLDAILASEPLRGPSRPSIEPLPSERLPAPKSTGGGPALPFRLSCLALALGAALLVISLLIGEPDWKRLDVNVRICAEPLLRPDGQCSAPRPDSVFATALFGPPAEGHTTQAVLTVDGNEIERSAALENPPQGRILPIRIVPRRFCDPECEATVSALVDGRTIYAQTVELDTEIETDIDR